MTWQWGVYSGQQLSCVGMKVNCKHIGVICRHLMLIFLAVIDWANVAKQPFQYRHTARHTASRLEKFTNNAPLFDIDVQLVIHVVQRELYMSSSLPISKAIVLWILWSSGFRKRHDDVIFAMDELFVLRSTSITRHETIMRSWMHQKRSNFTCPRSLDCGTSLLPHYWQLRGTHTRHCAYHARYRRLIPSNYNRTDRYLIGTDDRLARCTSHCKERIHSGLTSDQERSVAWRCHPQSFGGSANSDSNW